jgi:hypothetical protein
MQATYKPKHPNFHEKAHFVKADLAAHFGIERNGCVSFAMLPSALLVSPLLGDSVHCEILLFGLIEKALQSSERSLLLLAEGGPSSHCAVALSRSEAIGRTEAERVSL